METSEVRDIIQSVKNHLEENSGELAYWGETIKSSAVVASPVTLLNKAARLEQLRVETIGECRLCPLSETRNKIVFGVGNPETKVMFVGEGPGFDEDHQGVPFVGKAGKLLDKILAAIALDRTKVYIANIVKCHPMVDPTQPEKRGNDRPPAFDEMAACLPFLKQQISIIDPEIIVTLGGVATKALLNTTDGITKLRGKIQEINLIDGKQPISILPTYHPAALLRDENLKKAVWEDMKLLRSILGNPLSS
jgi:uracil-DNA glycosylase